MYHFYCLLLACFFHACSSDLPGMSSSKAEVNLLLSQQAYSPIKGYLAFDSIYLIGENNELVELVNQPLKLSLNSLVGQAVALNTKAVSQGRYKGLSINLNPAFIHDLSLVHDSQSDIALYNSENQLVTEETLQNTFQVFFEDVVNIDANNKQTLPITFDADLSLRLFADDGDKAHIVIRPAFFSEPLDDNAAYLAKGEGFYLEGQRIKLHQKDSDAQYTLQVSERLQIFSGATLVDHAKRLAYLDQSSDKQWVLEQGKGYQRLRLFSSRSLLNQEVSGVDGARIESFSLVDYADAQMQSFSSLVDNTAEFFDAKGNQLNAKPDMIKVGQHFHVAKSAGATSITLSNGEILAKVEKIEEAALTLKLISYNGKPQLGSIRTKKLSSQGIEKGRYIKMSAILLEDIYNLQSLSPLDSSQVNLGISLLPFGQQEVITFSKHDNKTLVVPANDVPLTLSVAQSGLHIANDIDQVNLEATSCQVLHMRGVTGPRSVNLDSRICGFYLSSQLALRHAHINAIEVQGKLANKRLTASKARVILYEPSDLDEIAIESLAEKTLAQAEDLFPERFWYDGLQTDIDKAKADFSAQRISYAKQFIQQISMAPEEPIVIFTRFQGEELSQLQGPEVEVPPISLTASEVLNNLDDLKASADIANDSLARSSWEDSMRKVGSHVSDFLMFEAEAKRFSSHSTLISDLNRYLTKQDILEKGSSLFDKFIRPQTTLDAALAEGENAKLQKDFDSQNSAKRQRRDHLAAIMALQWHMETLKPEDAQGQRGSTTISDFDNLQKFYLRYVQHCNEKKGAGAKLDYTQSASSLYKALAANIKSSTNPTASKLAYLRDGMSSHLKQKDLSAHQFGVDIRFASNLNSQALLPTGAEHLLLGFFDQASAETNFKTLMFYKMEGHGLATLADFKAHMLAWRSHNKSGKAGKGYRETRLDKDMARELINVTKERLAEKGAKLPDELEGDFLTNGAKEWTVGHYINRLNQTLIDAAVEDRLFIIEIAGDEPELKVGSEVRLTGEHFQQASALGIFDAENVFSNKNMVGIGLTRKLSNDPNQRVYVDTNGLLQDAQRAKSKKFSNLNKRYK